MPAQFAAMNTPRRLQPELRLKHAVLADAIRVYRGAGVKRCRQEEDDRAAQQEAKDWIASDASGCGFSFVEVCAALGRNPAKVRAQIAAIDESVLQIQLPRRATSREMIVAAA